MTSAAAEPAVRITDQGYIAARDRMLTEFEREYLAELLDRSENNLSEAARIAKVDRTTIYRLMERQGVQRTYTIPEQPEPAGFAADIEETATDDTK